MTIPSAKNHALYSHSHVSLISTYWGYTDTQTTTSQNLNPGPDTLSQVRINRRLGWPQMLSGCFEDKGTLFPCYKLMDDPFIIQPTKLPSCKIGSYPTGIKFSLINQNMNIPRHPQPDQSHLQHHTPYSMMLISTIRA